MSAAREPDAELFAKASDPPVRGFLHRAVAPNGDAMVLAHGAGSSSQAPLLVAVARAFADAGVTVLRCDLPFRQERPTGPPRPGDAARDREGLRNAVHAVGRLAGGRVFLGGHSYGGRQASLLAADEPAPVSTRGRRPLLLESPNSCAGGIRRVQRGAQRRPSCGARPASARS